MRWVELDLRRWASRHKKTLAWIADELGASTRNVSRWVKRGAVPEYIHECLPAMERLRGDLTRAQRIEIERQEWREKLDEMGPLAPTRELADHLWLCPWPWPVEAVLLAKLVLATAAPRSRAYRSVEGAVDGHAASDRLGELMQLWRATPLPPIPQHPEAHEIEKRWG